MQRTRRQISLVGRVQTAMSRLDENGTRATVGKRVSKRRPYADGEPLARWESEGGAIRGGSLSPPPSHSETVSD